MSALLDDIINLAVDGKQPLPDILRKCLLLGHELRNQRLTDWANQELSGYELPEATPEYRHIEASAKGHFIANFGRAELRNYLIPPAALEEKHRLWAREVFVAQSVSVLDGIVKSAEANKSALSFPWPGDMVLYYQQKLIDGYGLVAAGLDVPSSVITGILDSVRNRTLNMALQMKDELGTSYADLRRIEASEAAKIQSIVVNNIGGSANVAVSGISANATTVIGIGDRNALDQALTGLGIERQDLDDLTQAMNADTGKPGTNIAAWVKDKAPKVLVGGVKIGIEVGTQVLTALIMRYCGLH
jgi:hypothetical protein